MHVLDFAMLTEQLPDAELWFENEAAEDRPQTPAEDPDDLTSRRFGTLQPEGEDADHDWDADGEPRVGGIAEIVPDCLH